nr:helix-turn-helix transcriptional regulator [uncultured Dysosmobacter sp.]
MFYDNFLAACREKQTTPAQVRKALGISQSTMASWKSRSLTPKYGTVQKIADYLQIDWISLVPEDEQAETVITHMKEVLGNLSSPKARIDAALDKLNDTGQKEAIRRVEELTEVPKYQREKPKDAPTGVKDTTPPESPSDGPQEGK